MGLIKTLLATAILSLWALAARAEPITIVALGDSLTAGYLLAPGAGFPAQLERALRAEGLDIIVRDAGVSGDTTSGGLSRLDWSVGEDADAVIVALGGNDALRGLPPETTRQNLTQILDRLDERGLPVLVAGMLAPVNLGPDYGEAFKQVFDDLATRDIVFYPFFLEGVAANPALNLPDGIHPTAEGVGVMVENILPKVKDLITRASEHHT
ncbi:MAG: arylesterase [Pseudomonadota bacterium]